MSGRRACAICKASCPSRACPATSISGSAASAARSCSRRAARLSAIRTRIISAPPARNSGGRLTAGRGFSRSEPPFCKSGKSLSKSDLPTSGLRDRQVFAGCRAGADARPAVSGLTISGWIRISSSFSSLRVDVFLKNSPKNGNLAQKRDALDLPRGRVAVQAADHQRFAVRHLQRGSRPPDSQARHQKAADLHRRAVVQFADFRRHRHLNAVVADQGRADQQPHPVRLVFNGDGGADSAGSAAALGDGNGNFAADQNAALVAVQHHQARLAQNPRLVFGDQRVELSRKRQDALQIAASEQIAVECASALRNWPNRIGCAWNE